jgi:ATP-dependent Lon protease
LTDRFDNEKVVYALNELYKNDWHLYHNFFKPSFKLKNKKRIASKTIKQYDMPKTPYQRILDSKYIDSKTKEDLEYLFKTLDPFKLKKNIENKIKKVHYINRKRPCNSIIIN